MNALIKEIGGTFSLNKSEPIHRWYPYVEGYSSCLIAEELKKFFLNEALTLCPSARIDIPEREKLWMLHTHLKRINKLMSTLHNQDFSVYMTEMQDSLSYYLVPNNETKKKKLRQNEHSIDFNQFAIRLPQLSDTIEHYY